MTVGAGQVATAEKDQRGNMPGIVEKAGALKALDSHGCLVPQLTLVDGEFAALLEFFFFALVPLLYGAKETANAGVDFSIGIAFGSHGVASLGSNLSK
jgi:hypothetical protein